MMPVLLLDDEKERMMDVRRGRENVLGYGSIQPTLKKMVRLELKKIFAAGVDLEMDAENVDTSHGCARSA
jgi:hypothetical protein